MNETGSPNNCGSLEPGCVVLVYCGMYEEGGQWLVVSLVSWCRNLMTCSPCVSSNRGIGSIMTGPEDEGWSGSRRELGPWITWTTRVN